MTQEPKSERLLPCAHCRGEPFITRQTDEYLPSYKRYGVKCETCKIHTNDVLSHEDDSSGAIAELTRKWNTRVSESSGGVPSEYVMLPKKLPQNVVDFVHDQRRKKYGMRFNPDMFTQDIYDLILSALQIAAAPTVQKEG